MDATADNREKLEAWILEYYAASAINTCKRQKMPSTTGPPVKILVDPGATPVAILKPIPVPLHYRAEVKTALDADVARGVLERTPLGIPTTWCARMLIQPKKDGGARRLVDLSALTKVCAREIHHMEPIQGGLFYPSQHSEDNIGLQGWLSWGGNPGGGQRKDEFPD